MVKPKLTFALNLCTIYIWLHTLDKEQATAVFMSTNYINVMEVLQYNIILYSTYYIY